MGLGSVMVLLCSSVTFAESFWAERVACTLGNLSYLLCHRENVFVFLHTCYWLSGSTSLQELWGAAVCVMERAVPLVSNGFRNCLF